MGEIAEMMMEGLLCQTCGEYMDHEQAAQGYPVSCPDCIEVGHAPIATESKRQTGKSAQRRRAHARKAARKAEKAKP